MIKRYSQFISDLVKSLTKNGEEYTWGDFGVLMKDTLLLVLIILFMTVGLYSLLYFIPKMCYGKTVGVMVEKMNAAFEKAGEDFTEYNKYKKKATRAKRLYVLGMITIYVPFVIPVLLMCINVLF